ncbi:MAG: helix-turn-helix domain protein [Actinomycetia bacterium]|nr:helix-turn-helix domain protein [Actinomycetes bacterium]
MDAHEIAARARAWRQRRGLSQQQVADALGRHVTWVKKFEAGDRQADPRISVLTDLARVLDVPLEVLLGSDPGPRQAQDPRIADVRAALLVPVQPDHGRPAEVLTRRVVYGYDAYQASDYRTLGRQLPGLITDARAAVKARPGDPEARHALAEACHLTAITLMKFGDAPTAWHAADRALSTAETLTDPVTIALCAQALTWAATGVGQGTAGVAVAQAVLDSHGPALSRMGEEGWTAIGMLQLKAAVAAAAASDPSLTRDMIAAARKAAGHVRADANVRRTGFNATNVLLYESSVLAQLGDHAGALSAAARIHPAALDAIPRERQTHHLIEIASSELALGHADTALEMLTHAERISSQEVRSLPAAREVITGLVHARRGPGRPNELRELARRAGVAG